MIHRGRTSFATFYYVHSHCGVQPENRRVLRDNDAVVCCINCASGGERS